jgi:microcystin-dependent protein
MTAYLLQQGIPEWDSATTYYLNSVVQANSGQWFNSLQDNNLGNAPPVSASNAFWAWVNAPPVIPQAVAIGTIIDHAGGATPSGYLPCDGAAVSRITYAPLFAQIGIIWGAGNSPDTFNVPDMRRRVGVGFGGPPGPNLGNAVGNVGGAETHVLTIAEMPAHTHGLGVSVLTPGGSANANTGTGTNTGSTGGGGAHNNMQPSAVVVKLIKT